MKPKDNRLAKQYASAMRRYLAPGKSKDLRPALRLGRAAVAIGLETLDLARIHEETLSLLGFANGPQAIVKRGERFFTEAITPIIESHRASRERILQLKNHSEMLRKRTMELTSVNRDLRQGIIRRKNVEAALKKTGEHYAHLLKESLRLQEGLRRLTRQVLFAQEDERKKISSELQNQIAQTLLGINVRLYSLKQEARFDLTDFQSEIFTTRKLVTKSALSVQRVAREVGNR